VIPAAARSRAEAGAPHGDGWVLRSAGACQGVTGSAHRLRCGDTRVLIDAGMFQGGDAEAGANEAAWPFDPRTLDAVVLTHGHLDHVGRLPKLVADGFRGPVYATAATLAVAEVVLRDAARIQHEDAARERRRRKRAGGDPGAVRPLYREQDVDAALNRARAVDFGRRVELGDGVTFRFGRAGHVLGAAWVALEGNGVTVVASGDLGDDDGPLHPPPAPPPRADAVLIESTYGDRRHRDAASTRAEFADVVRATLRRGGNVLIPTFALERTQAVLWALADLEREGAIPRRPVVLDAPMGARMTELYRSHPETLRPELAARLAAGEDPFAPADFETTTSFAASQRLAHARGVVIVAGAGMMTGGRILHHLRAHLGEPANALVVVGYQAEGTLGREIVDGARSVRVLGRRVPVAASVHTINGFSAHADAAALDRWLAAADPGTVVPVHGEAAARAALAERAAERGYRVLDAPLGVDLAL
jgi:metallo-beta-lactamase family protein